MVNLVYMAVTRGKHILQTITSSSPHLLEIMKFPLRSLLSIGMRATHFGLSTYCMALLAAFVLLRRLPRVLWLLNREIEWDG